MSRDIEMLLREMTDGAQTVDGLALPSQVRRRGDRRRMARRGSAVAVTVLVVVGAAVGVGNLPSSPSVPPAQPGPTASPAVPSLRAFPAPTDLHHGTPAVTRTTGTGPDNIAANMVGTTTTYFTCVGGGSFKVILGVKPVSANGTTYGTGGCNGDLVAWTLTYGSNASTNLLQIRTDPDAHWAIQVVPGTAKLG